MTALLPTTTITTAGTVTGATFQQAVQGSICVYANFADDTALDGVFGPFWRVKLITTGTYAGGTTLRLDVVGPGWN